MLLPSLPADAEAGLLAQLGSVSPQPVALASPDQTVTAGRVYVLPSRTALVLSVDRARFRALASHGSPSNLASPGSPTDVFLHSVALSQSDSAVVLLLPGVSIDYLRGVRALRASGGLALALSSQEDGRGLDPLLSSQIDFSLAASELVPRLRQIASSPPLFAAGSSLAPDQDSSGHLPDILRLLRAHTDHDFSGYKESTIHRRIERRMMVNQISSLYEYAQFLSSMPQEIESLFREMLIGVTGFFRDPEVFERLQQRVILPLFAQQRDSLRPIRVWIPGCSTGEEAYSIAMLLHEQLERSRQHVEVQLFATDIDDDAIRVAREGVYAASIVSELSPERLRTYFIRDKRTGAYRVTSGLRDMVIFATHNVVRDPPFSRIDLISCRNLLIYFNSGLQHRLLQLLHFALNARGFLLLGASETLGNAQRLFFTVDQEARIFQRLQTTATLRPSSLFPAGTTNRREPSPAQPAGERAVSLREVTEQALLAEHAPTTILINDQGDMLYVHGRTGRYLEHATGEASTNLLKVARDELRAPLAALLRELSESRVAHVSEPVWLGGDDGVGRHVRLALTPVSRPEAPPGLSLLTISELPTALDERPLASPATSEAPDAPARDRVQQLERELRSTREYLRSTIEELEHTNEELRTTNDQLQSANEELQSTNEELQTSKEELQSVNEELAAVNAELQTKIVELLDINNDIKNLFDHSEVGIIFLDLQLRIRRFTPMARLIVDMIPEDIGRPLAQFTHTLHYDGFLSDIRVVAEKRVTIEHEAESLSGDWFLIRIIPYRTITNTEDGVVITFANITQIKKADQARRESEIKFQKAFDHSPLMKAILDGRTGTIIDVNQQFLRAGGYTKEDLLGKTPVELGWTTPNERQQLMAALAMTGSVNAYERSFFRKDGSTLPVLYTAFVIEVGGKRQIVSVSQDIEARRAAEEALRRSEARLRTIIDIAPVGLAVLDANRTLLAMNASAESTFDVTAAGILSGKYEGRRYLRADGSPFPPSEFASVRALREGRAITDIEIGVVKEDGTLIWGLTHAAPLPDGGVVLAMQDIGERKRVEQELRTNATKLELIFNKAPFAIGLLRLSDSIIVDVNDAFVRLFGYSREESIGKTTVELGLRPNVLVRAQLLAKLREGADISDCEMDLVTRAGERRSLLISMSVLAILEERFYIATVEDITAQLQAKAALRASETKYQDLFDHSPDMYLTIDATQDRIVDCNQTTLQLLGYDKSELIGRPVVDLFEPSHADHWRERLQSDFMRTGELQNERARLRGKAGRLRDVSISVTGSRDEAGRVVSGRLVFRDITERLRDEEALRTQLTQEKETVMRELAHRTKNNMLVIRSMLSLQAMRSASEEVKRLVADVDSKILAMALVHQKLYESRNLSRIDLGEYLRDLALALSSSFSLVPGQVTLNIVTEPMVTLIDTAVPCGLVVTELVSNAFKHAFPGGRSGEIRIELSRRTPERAQLRVADNGVALPPGFDFRKGSMLGLRTVYMIVEHQLKGSVQFSTPGIGVVCEIEFPDTQYSERV